MGPWPEDDRDANFKSDVALYSLVDPLTIIGNLGVGVGVPPGAICRYVLAKWASGGSGGLLEFGPTMTRRLAEVCEPAADAGTDEAHLEAFAQLREMILWLRMPVGCQNSIRPLTSDLAGSWKTGSSPLEASSRTS